MKKTLSMFIAAASFLLMTIAFNACKKTSDTNAHTPAAGLMAFNLVPDSTAVGFSLSGNNFTATPLGYTDYTGNYRSVYTGTRNVTAYNFYTGAALATTSQLFADSAYYSAFAVGTNGNYKNVVVQDNFDSLSAASGDAFVRYINAIPDSTLQPTVTISSGGSNVIDTTAAFSGISNFKGITPGDISINVNTESGATANRTITVEQGKIYTILLVGQPAA
ncbi:MAG: DUF4397 domain-containing protein, partial [Ginsengibacter sp.]